MRPASPARGDRVAEWRQSDRVCLLVASLAGAAADRSGPAAQTSHAGSQHRPPVRAHDASPVDRAREPDGADPGGQGSSPRRRVPPVPRARAPRRVRRRQAGARPGGGRDRLDDPAVRPAGPNGLVVGAALTQDCDQPCISPLHTHDPTGSCTPRRRRRSRTARPVLHPVERRATNGCVGETAR